MSCNPGRLAFAPMLILLGLIPAQSVGQTPDAAQNIFKHYFETKLQDEPEFATTTGHYENADKWNDWSKAGRELRRKHAEETLSDLEKLPAQEISGADDVSVRLLKYDLRLQLEADDLETHLLRVGQLFGLHTRVYTTIDRMPARTVHDYENLLARLHGVPVYVDQNIDILNEAIARKMTQSKIVTDLVAQQLAAQMAQDPGHSALLEGFRKIPSNIPQAEQQRL